ncbi:MAG: VCBS repeat-containing protein, partial [Chloroflexi bacterium]|nr:VCBS repeat-containing protein [Chloroflexota bacterium]
MAIYAMVRPVAAQPPRLSAVGQPGVFIDSGQFFSPENSQAVALGDLDSDGDLDAFLANIGPDRVWLNDGSGRFEATAQDLGDDYSTSVALGDLDDDGDLDAVVGNAYGQPNRVWL